MNLITELEKISLCPDFVTEEQEQRIIKLFNERVSEILKPHIIDVLWAEEGEGGPIFKPNEELCINDCNKRKTVLGYQITDSVKGVWAWISNEREPVWIKNLLGSNTSDGVINEITGQPIEVRRAEIFEDTDTIIAMPLQYENVLYGIYSIEWPRQESPPQQVLQVIESISESIARIRWKVEIFKDNQAQTSEAIKIFEKMLPKTRVDEIPEIESREVFIVHGHDEELKKKIVKLLEDCSLIPIVLSEQPDRGRTIVEKLEAHASVPYVVVLITPDDVGGLTKDALRGRARQNVILELGYFYGKLTRKRVCCLNMGVELPSDILGITYIPYDGDWEGKLKRELSEVFTDLPSEADKMSSLVHNELPLVR